MSGADESLARTADVLRLRRQPFVDPDPYGQLTHSSRLDTLRGVSDLLHRPLARLNEDDLAFVNALVKAAIEQDIRARFLPRRPGAAEETSQC